MPPQLFDVQAEYGNVVHHNDVRLLSRGSALQRFYSLRGEIKSSGQLMPEPSDPVWLADLGFSVDTTKHLNTLNMSLRGQKRSGEPTVLTYQSLWNRAATFSKALVKNAAQYKKISQGITISFPQDNIEEICSRHGISS